MAYSPAVSLSWALNDSLATTELQRETAKTIPSDKLWRGNAAGRSLTPGASARLP